jgi:hypothetical protein
MNVDPEIRAVPQYHLPAFLLQSLFAPYGELLDSLRRRRAQGAEAKGTN